jgi:HPr kinase/phosphorylase
VRTPPPMPVARLLQAERLRSLALRVLAGEGGLERNLIAGPRIQKPGLALAGFFPYVREGRLQIVGASEFSYLATLPAGEAVQRWKHLLTLGVPAVVAAKDLRPPKEVLAFCEEHGVPFLVTARQTSEVISAVSNFLEEALAPRIQAHGVLVDVFSLGTLIVGDAGIGKSECALELVYRGHRLVADDIVVIRRTHGNGLLGAAHPNLENFLELRGVGIIDVRKHFGMTATSPGVHLSLMIRLVKLSEATRKLERRWREQLMTDARPWVETHDILGVDVPLYTMAVAPGRDVAIMVETAVRKCLLAQRGVDDERVFIESVNKRAAGFETEDLTLDDE